MNGKEALVYAAMTSLAVMVVLGGSSGLSAYPARMSGYGHALPVYGEVAPAGEVRSEPAFPHGRGIAPVSEIQAAEPASVKPCIVRIRRGQTLSSILKRRGVKAWEVAALDRSINGVFDIRGIKPGMTLRLWLNSTGKQRIAKLTYQIDAAHRLEVHSHRGAFTARTVSSAGPGDGARSMATTPRIDDLISFSMTIPDVIVPDWSERDAALDFLSAPPPRRIETSPGHRPARHAVAHKKLFIKAPLRYKRISSGYSHSRLHPIYRVRRPHLGIDYAAPAGTSVRAVGQGTVVYVGWSGGFGRCVHIRHPYGYTTYYGHLSRYAHGISVGKRIAQGSVIGYVGTSGVATGPHLDFRVSHKGRFINPLTLGKVKKPV